MAFGIANTLGLLAFLSLIPLIILYLIRPKARTLNIPSLMFFMKQSDKKQKRSFLRQFTKDWLFLIQLLIILFLSFQVASPYIELNQKVISDHTVIVLDISASSQVIQGTKTRFQKSIELAKEQLGKSNSLILIENTPIIALKEKSRKETIEYLESLTPSDTSSKIGEAIILAGEFLNNDQGRIIVISDFINTEGTPPQTAANIIKARGINIDFISTIDSNVNSKNENIGIIKLDITPDSTTIQIKNFKNNDETVRISINDQEKELNVKAKSAEPYVFKTPQGITKIQLKVDDDFLIDNTAYISAPLEGLVKILLITNNQSLFLKSALNASGIADVEISEPPVLSNKDYDIYIFYELDPAKILTGSISEISKKVDEGASAVIIAQEGINKLGYKDLLNVELQDKQESGVANIVKKTSFTKDIELGVVNNYFLAKNKDSTMSIVEANNNSIITLSKKGNGKTVYLGIIESENEFKFSPAYPIFWSELLGFLTDKKTLRNLNAKTGDNLILEIEDTIKTPKKTIRSNNIFFDKIGLYEMKDRKIAVSLLNELESDINPIQITEKQEKQIEFSSSKEKTAISLEVPLLIIAIILILLEIVYIKFRGEI